MNTKSRLALVTALALTAVQPGLALAQGAGTENSDPTWQASYYNNRSLSGSPAMQRSDADINFDWGSGSPGSGIAGDNFSVRWSKYIDVSGGTYRFTTTSDDGTRVYVDNQRIIDDWNVHAPTTRTADKSLAAGHHLVVVEYFEAEQGAVARMSWAPVTTISNWRGEYYNNLSLSGSPALVRDDASINFAWSGSPAPGINADGFSVRWTRSLNLGAGSYVFTVTADDGVRLWVNNHLLIDQWRLQAPTTYTGQIYLPGGSVSVKMEFYDNTQGATAKLSWSNTGGANTPGTVIVDDMDTGFDKGGDPYGWRTANEGYNNRLTWTRNNKEHQANYNWARWYPKLTAGRYEVFVYIPDRYSTTTKATYWIAHADGYTSKQVNQSANGGRWISLGTYLFRGTSADYLSLNDTTEVGS